MNESPVLPGLLPTKLFIPPPRHDLVARPRLSEIMGRAVQRKLTIVSAPAGFGKTSFVSQWIPQSDRRVVWVSLDRNDNDPIRFWMYVLGSLRTVGPAIGNTTLALLQSRELPSRETIMTTLLNDVAAIPGALALVLDDYHAIESPEIHEAVTFFIEHLPPTLHLIILSRADPMLPLSRLRARREMTELRASDLRFTRAETSAFLTGVMNISIADDDVTALDHRTEGWIAGLQLAALSMRGHNNVSSFVREFTGDDRYILDYLIEEVFRNQHPDVQEFLLQTSILDRLNGPLCDAVREGTGGAKMLENLEATNLFLFPLDNTRTWYRYHHLFADLLRARLQRTQPEILHQLHGRASLWLESQGFMEEAIQHALHAKDWNRAALLIETVALKLIVRSQHGILLRWIRSLPDAALDQRPDLCLWYSYVLLHLAEFDQCEHYLQKAESSWREGTNNAQLAAVWNGRGMIAFGRGDAQNALAAGQKAVALVQSNVPMQYSVGLVCTGIGNFLLGRLGEAETAFQEAMSLTERSGNPVAHYSAGGWLGSVQTARGKLHAAAETLRHMTRLENIEFGNVVIAVHSAFCLVEREWNHMAEATRHLEICLDIDRRNGSLKGWLLTADRVRALTRLLWERGNASRALKIIEDQELGAKKNRNEICLRYLGALRALLNLWEGNTRQALRWMEEQEPSSDRRIGHQEEILFVVRSRILLAAGRYREACRVLQQCLRSAETDGRVASTIEFLVLSAVAMKSLGETERSIDAMSRAITLGEPGGFIRTFIDGGKPVVDILRECVRVSRKETINPLLEQYVTAILAAFPTEMTVPPGRDDSALSATYLLDPLSDREVEVLKLLATGMANADMARKLFLSPGTIKRHVNNIYGKLNVHSRMEAVAKARELKLLREDATET